MWVNIFLVIVLFFLLINFGTMSNNKKDTKQLEQFMINYNEDSSDNIHMIDAIHNKQVVEDPFYDKKTAETDMYRNNFFSFQNRINNTSHLGDPVDNMNINGLSGKQVIGKDIAEIYDELVNSNDYKK